MLKIRATLFACLFISTSFLTAVKAIETPPWGVERISVRCVWDKNMDMSVDQGANAGQYTGYNENVTVAVIDDGIDTDHPDLEDRIIGGINFWEDGNDIRNNSNYEAGVIDTHGTCVAGIIAAIDNEDGVVGVAPKVMMYIIRLEQDTQRLLAYAIDHAVAAGCKIVTITCGWDWGHSGLLEACRDAYLDGVLVVAAAGNENLTNGICYPAKYDDYVLAVGATDKNDNRWTKGELGSNMGPELDLMAPGEEIYTTALNADYGNFSMTSAATPHVAGVVALMWAGRLDDDWDWGSGGYWNPDELEIKLETKALDLGQPWKDDEFGFGLVNAWRACQVPEGDLDDSFNVTIIDIVIVARAFGSQPNESEWSPLANINIDEYIDIFDIVIVAANFGKVDQP